MSKKDREAGGIVTDFAKFSVTQLKNVATVLGKSQGSFLLFIKQALIKHRKDTFGSNDMDHAKCGFANEEDLVEAHAQCDLAYVIKGNRQFVMLLHDAVYPKGSKFTKATTKLQSLLDGPLVKKVLQGTSLGDEEQWGPCLAYPCHIYLDTFMLPYGGDDGACQWHFHRGFEHSSLVVYRREKPQDLF